MGTGCYWQVVAPEIAWMTLGWLQKKSGCGFAVYALAFEDGFCEMTRLRRPAMMQELGK